jgi:hypothetical protein
MHAQGLLLETKTAGHAWSMQYHGCGSMEILKFVNSGTGWCHSWCQMRPLMGLQVLHFVSGE